MGCVGLQPASSHVCHSFPDLSGWPCIECIDGVVGRDETGER
jgi:hypothetical protein